MAIVAVTIGDVATALGREEPPAVGVEARQWSMWLEDARMLIRARLGDLEALDQTALDYVVREAVTAQVRRPDDATSVEVAIDDGRVARRYSSGPGRVHIRDEWWTLLDPSGSSQSAFAIDTIGNGSVVVHADICALRFGAQYCSCGAVLTARFPLYEYTGESW